MCARKFNLLLLSALLWSSPAIVAAEIYQWTDSRGIIHFTDSLDRVPEALRGSPKLSVRAEADLKAEAIEAFGPEPAAPQTPLPEPELAEKPRPSEPEPAKAPPPTVHYNPQYFTVVVNSVVHKPRRGGCSQNCRGVFRPSFSDRRYIHPSVFDNSPRQFVRP